MAEFGNWLWANADKLAGLAQVVIGAAAILALVTTVLALRGTSRAIGMQGDELRAIQAQLNIENRRFQREQLLARPRLRIRDVIVRDSDDGLQPAEVILRWSHGTDPADKVVIWICTQAKTLCGEIRYMAPADQELTVRLRELPYSERERCPFPWRSHVGASNSFWVGVTWLRLDGRKVGFSEQFVDHHAALIEGGIERETITRIPGPAPDSVAIETD